MNIRPRKRFGYKCPIEVITEVADMTPTSVQQLCCGQLLQPPCLIEQRREGLMVGSETGDK